jgi:valyl-tRNA synthetase
VISAISRLETTGGTNPEYTLADSWVWARMQQLVRDVERLFQTYQYGEAGRQIYEFFWSEFADWYVEIAKEQMKSEGTRERTVSTLARVLDISLRLLHPFTPFVTEELWGRLRESLLDSPLAALASDWPEALIVAPWPEPRRLEGWEEVTIDKFAREQDVIRTVRNLCAEHNIKASTITPIIVPGREQDYDLFTANSGTIAALSGTLAPNVVRPFEYNPDEYIGRVSGSTEILVTIAEVTDPFDQEARRTRELADAEAQITRLEKLLAGDFAAKAPQAVVAKERERLAGFKETAGKLRSQLGK